MAHRFLSATIIAAVFLMSFNLYADDRKKYCQHMGDVAYAAMSSRQAGVPLATMLLLIADEIAIEIFKRAYEHPLASSTESRQNSITEYSGLVDSSL